MAIKALEDVVDGGSVAFDDLSQQAQEIIDSLSGAMTPGAASSPASTSGPAATSSPAGGSAT